MRFSPCFLRVCLLQQKSSQLRGGQVSQDVLPGRRQHRPLVIREKLLQGGRNKRGWGGHLQAEWAAGETEARLAQGPGLQAEQPPPSMRTTILTMTKESRRKR